MNIIFEKYATPIQLKIDENSDLIFTTLHKIIET